MYNSKRCIMVWIAIFAWITLISHIAAFQESNSDLLAGLSTPFSNHAWDEEDAKKFTRLIKVFDDFLPDHVQGGFAAEADLLFSSIPPDDREGIVQPVGQFMYCAVYGITPNSTTLWGSEREGKPGFSDQFQLLPSNILVFSGSKKVKLLSYINNLDPRVHMNLYKGIELLLQKSIPAFESILGGILPSQHDISLDGRTLQVIIGVRGTFTHPDRSSEYPGGVWHTEGMANERIVASSVFYYDVSNILHSNLGFRVQLGGKRQFKEVVNVTAKTNRFVAFPNVIQHNVLPFKAEVPDVPGRRMAVTISLVDPSRRILSTGDVPPQQSDWYPIHKDSLDPATAALFPSLQDGKPITMEDALKYRQMAIDERRVRKQYLKPENHESAARDKLEL